VVPEWIFFLPLQSEVGAEIDDFVSQLHPTVDLLHRPTVGQRQKEEVAGLNFLGKTKGQLRALAKMGVRR
jgi:hypothetical protein